MKEPSMRRLAIVLLMTVTALFGCAREIANSDFAIGGFIDDLREQGIDGTLEVHPVDNEDIEYVASYVVSKFTSTRILSFFKCTTVESAEANLKEAMSNTKMSGQARNGTLIMAATFYPPDDEAVDKIRALFLDYKFD